METKQKKLQVYFSNLNNLLAKAYFEKVGVFSLSPNLTENQISYGEEKTEQDQAKSLQGYQESCSLLPLPS